MAVGTTTESDVKRSIENLSNELDNVFKKIQSEAFKLFDGLASAPDGLTKGFKDAVKEINNMSSVADRYNAYSKLSESIQSRINELKSKTGYLDSVSLAFKEQEMILQNNIARAQINGIKRSVLDNAVKIKAIDALNTQIILRETELDYLKNNSTSQNEIIEKLEKQLEKIKDISPELQKQKGFLSSISSLYNDIKTENQIIFYIASKIVTAFTSIEDAAFEVRKNLGLIGKEGDRFKTIITDVYVRFANLGVTTETVGKTINSIANGLGSSLLITQEMVENFSIIETSLGIASEQSVKVARTLAGISKSSSMSQSSMIGFVKELSRAAGTSFVRVMEDLANLGESVRLTFRGTSVQLIKSTVEARRLGLSISDVGVAAEKLLDFQESITAEIEASVMLGRNISFNDARVLAYRGDILGATKQILDTVEKTADLNQLDYFTLKAIAASTGLTVDKLQESLQIRKDLRLVEAMGTEEARKLTSEYKSLNNMSESFAKSEGERAIENLKNVNNLALQKQLQTELNGLILQLGQAFLPVLQSLASVLQIFTDINTWLRTTIGDTGAKWVSALLLTGAAVMTLKGKWIDMFTSILKYTKIMQTTQSVADVSGAVSGAAGSVAGGVSMWKNLLGVSAIILATAGALFIIGKALKEFPADIGGMGYFEFFTELTLGLAVFIGGLVALGASFEFIAPLLGIGSAVILGISGVLYLLGKSMQSIANPIKTFSDSFSKLIENINVDNLSRMKDGVVAVKEAMSELRDELQKFKKDDLDVLDKLGNFKTNISTGVKGEVVPGKETSNVALAETIRSAVVEGMRQVKIDIKLNGKSLVNEIAVISSVNQPATTYNVLSNQASFS